MSALLTLIFLSFFLLLAYSGNLEGALPFALVFYLTALVGDLWTTREGLKLGLKEANPLYRMGPRTIPLGSLGLLSLLFFFLGKLFPTGEALTLAFLIGGGGHLSAFLWNLGWLLEANRP